MGGQARQQQDLVPGPLAPGEAHCGHGQVTPGEEPDRPHQGMNLSTHTGERAAIALTGFSLNDARVN